ncbi:hypothetical protein [Xanthomonas arboricola]
MIDTLHSRRMSGTKQKARSDAGFLFTGNPHPHPALRATFSRCEKVHQPEIASRSW